MTQPGGPCSARGGDRAQRGAAEGEEVEEEELPGRAAAPERRDAEDREQHRADQAEEDDALPEGHEEVGRLLDPGAEAEGLRPQDLAPQADRLQVALGPAGALAEERARLREALLGDHGAQVLAPLPARRDQPQPEVLVL